MPDILSTINSPQDLGGLTLSQLRQLAQEIRDRIIDVVYKNGGHLGSFDFSRDRLIWDVGHQVYTHKLITGRRDAFETLRRRNGLSGFPNTKESSYDLFISGHAGTAISTALGMACGDSICSNDERRVVAVVGDGAIASGMPFEALNHAGALKRNMLIVLNDNKMSIANSVGALPTCLTHMRSAPAYIGLKKEIAHLLDLLPVFGGRMKDLLDQVKDAVRRQLTPGRLFEDFGFRYFGPIDGHNFAELTSTLESVRQLGGPILLHVMTEKGKGYEAAVKHKHCMHSVSPEKVELPKDGKPSWTSVFEQQLIDMATEDEHLVVITVAMPDLTLHYAEKFPERHYDPGICEQHALGLASGLAASGAKPVVAIYSTFLQRAYDQVFHEICLQEAPVLFGIDRAGLVGGDGPTHHGVFDIAYLRHLPNLTLMAPKDAPELKQMMHTALASRRPCAIRLPRETVPDELGGGEPLEIGKAEIIQRGHDGLIIGYGATVARAVQAAEILARDGIRVTVVNARFAKPLDRRLVELIADAPAAVIAEDGAIAGGIGSAILELAADSGVSTAHVKRLGVPDRFIEHGPRDELLQMLNLHPDGIASALKETQARVH